MKTSKKPFTVTVEFDFVVVATDQADAMKVAKANAIQAFKDQAYADMLWMINQGVHAEGWDGRAVPYGSLDDRPLSDYMEDE